MRLVALVAVVFRWHFMGRRTLSLFLLCAFRPPGGSNAIYHGYANRHVKLFAQKHGLARL